MKTVVAFGIILTVFICIFVVAGIVYFEFLPKTGDSSTGKSIVINYRTEKVSQYGEGSYIITPNDSYTFLKVDLTVENNGYADFYSGCLSDLSLNADNEVYTICSRISHNNYNFLPATLLNGDSWSGTIVYEVPANTSTCYLYGGDGYLADFKTEYNCED